jgi:1-aminocyclopropane-1-carboxylate deaminase
MPNEKEIVNKAGASIDALDLTELKEKDLEVDVLRLDKIHPVISGNKWFKLKYFLEEASRLQRKTLITFGGAFSNHIIATAFAAKTLQLKSVGIIRGEKPVSLSHTLKLAKEYGMELIFISRKQYASNEEEFLKNLALKHPGALIIPEGGAGLNGVRGSAEILKLTTDNAYTHILCAIGTGTTFIGLANAAQANQTVTGICVLKGVQDILSGKELLLKTTDRVKNRSIIYDYHFGGYAKKNPELFRYMNMFHSRTGIKTDFVYTGKLFFAAFDLIQHDFFPVKSRLLVVHSGGLQGNDSLPKGTLNFN